MGKIGIIGGGLNGLCTAWFLSEAGCEVTVIDKSGLPDSCSYGNAGMIVPSHVIPLAAPGIISKGIRWLMDAKSPFYIKPSLNRHLLNWGWHFYRSATAKNVEKCVPLLRDISLLSRDLYNKLAADPELDFEFFERGLLMLYLTTKTEHEEIEAAEIANHAGVEAKILNASAVQAMEPDVKVAVRGGIYYPGDAHLCPAEFMQALKAGLEKRKVAFCYAEVKDFKTDVKKLRTVITTKGEFSFDEVVISAGAWTPFLAEKLSAKLPMLGGKGYSFELAGWGHKVRIPSLLQDHRVSVTPMGNHLRLGGTMEIGSLKQSINASRVQGIAEAVPQYYPDINVRMPEISKVWSGFRPCSPDGLPYIGRLKKYQNVIIASGHGMMGLSLAPATGKLVSEMILQRKTSIPLDHFKPERM